MIRLAGIIALFALAALTGCSKDADQLVGDKHATFAIIDRPAHVDQLPDTVDMLWVSKLSLQDVRRACERLPKLTSLKLSNCTGELTEPLPNAPEDLTLEHMEFSLATLDNLAGRAKEVSVLRCTVTASASETKIQPDRLSLRFCNRDSSSALLRHVDSSSLVGLTFFVDDWFGDGDLRQFGPYPELLRLQLQCKSVTLTPGSLTAAQFPKLIDLFIWGASLHARAGSTLISLPALSRLDLKDCVVPPQIFVDLKVAPALKNVELESCSGYSPTDTEFTRYDSSPWQLMEK